MLRRWAGMAREVLDRLTEAPDPRRAKPLPRRPRTLADFWKVHHAPHLDVGRPGTRRQQAYRWRYWIEPALGHLRWSEIDKRRVAAFLTGLRAQGHCNKDAGQPRLAPRTIGNVFATLSAVLSHAVDLDYLENNPCIAARRYLPEDAPAERNRTRPRALSLEHARRLCSLPELVASMPPRDPRYAVAPALLELRRAEYVFAVLTCARRGEIHGLRWQCVSLDAATPFVRIEKSHHGPTKTGRPRDVPLHPELLPLLRRLDDARRARARASDREPDGAELVFPNAFGRMQGHHGAEHLSKSLALLGLPRIVYHGLRHTGATLYRAAGVRRDDVAEVLGHSTTVTDLYAPPQLHVLAGKLTRLRLLAAQDSCTPATPDAGDRNSGESKLDGAAFSVRSMKPLPMHTTNSPAPETERPSMHDFSSPAEPRLARTEAPRAYGTPAQHYAIDLLRELDEEPIPDTEREPAAADDLADFDPSGALMPARDQQRQPRRPRAPYAWTHPASPWMAGAAIEIEPIHRGVGAPWGRSSRIEQLVAAARPLTRGGLVR